MKTGNYPLPSRLKEKSTEHLFTTNSMTSSMIFQPI